MAERQGFEAGVRTVPHMGSIPGEKPLVHIYFAIALLHYSSMTDLTIQV